MLAGSEVNDDPLAPISTWGARRIAEAGDDAAIEWLGSEARYSEKTRHAGRLDRRPARRHRSRSRRRPAVSPTPIPRSSTSESFRAPTAASSRSTSCPTSRRASRSGLLNLLEERDLQIRGFPVRLALDMLFAFSANPEDYTNRGSIITPLRDRIASQILTHYPPSAALAAQITAQEAWTERDDIADRDHRGGAPAGRGDLDRGPRERARRPDARESRRGWRSRRSSSWSRISSAGP